MAKRLTHRADGVYFINVRMLQRAGACAYTTMQFYRSYGENNVLVTLSKLSVFLRKNGGGHWLMRCMRDKSVITQEEKDIFTNAIAGVFGGPYLPVAKAIMAALEARAVREGRLPPAK